MASAALVLLRCLYRQFLPVKNTYHFKATHASRNDDPDRRNMILDPQYRVVKKVCIHALDIQYDRFTGWFCVNLGVHFRFLPMSWNDQLPVPYRMDAAACVYQSRLASEGIGDRWWPVSADETETRQSVQECIALFERCGIPFFDKYGVLPGPYGSIAIDDLDSGAYKRALPDWKNRSPAIVAAILAYISKHLQRTEQVEAFAAFARSRSDPRFRDRIERYLGSL